MATTPDMRPAGSLNELKRHSDLPKIQNVSELRGATTSSKVRLEDSGELRDLKEIRSALGQGSNMIIQATPTNSNNLDVTDRDAAIMSNRYYLS
jgi:hypothetical protein